MRKKILYFGLLVVFASLFLANYDKCKNILLDNFFYKTSVYNYLINTRVNNYLIKKYNLRKNDFNIVSSVDMVCDSCEAVLPVCPGKYKFKYYCGKDFIYNIKGKTTNIKYIRSLYYRYSDKYDIKDDYQTDLIVNDFETNKFTKNQVQLILNFQKNQNLDNSCNLNIDYLPFFQRMISRKIYSTKTPLVCGLNLGSVTIHSRNSDGYYLEFYDGDLLKFFQKEILDYNDFLLIRLKEEIF